MTQARLTQARPEGGFTLIEVMISILLTAIAVIGIIALYMTETRASSYSRHATEATMLATDKLEKLRTQSAPTVATTGSDTDLDALGASPGIFSRDWVQTPVPSVIPFLYINLQVTVSWDEDGVPKSVIVHGRRAP